MSIKTRLLAPFAVAIGLTLVSAGWIAGAALMSADATDKVVRGSLDAIVLSDQIGAEFDAAQSVYAKVTAMTRLYTREEIAAPFEAATDAMRDRLTRLEATGLSETMATESRALAEAVAAWEGDARIVLGLTTAREIPSAEQMRRHATRLSAGLETVATLAESEARRLSEEAGVEFRSSLTIAAALITALLIVVSIVASRAITRLGGSLVAMSRSMTELAGGKTEIAALDQARTDELGDMARAIAVFRDALIERGRLEESQRAEMARRAEQQQASDAFQQRVRAVVNAAVDGDFSQRLDLETTEEEFFDYARRVNKLVDAVDQGVGATKAMLAALAQADLTARMDGDFKGAFAELRDDANATAETLTKLIDEVRVAAIQARAASHRVGESAVTLSDRGESQAAALEETSATMEEIASSVKTSSDNAEQANKIAGEATARALRGKEIMVDAVGAVREIEQSSSKITEIISVIDGLAFQTNLLALNAAVEAARAGDAGKGFAVVASEVRTLAQRSADAARDIKELIEISSVSVGKGVSLVEATGGSLDEIRESIDHLAAAISTVSDAAREQALGVAEVSSSVAQIDEMTRQNADLARDGAENGRALEETIARLETLIAGFRTKVAAERAAA